MSFREEGEIMSEIIALCLRCLQKSLLSISIYNYPIVAEGTRFPASVIRATPYRRYWRKKCEECGERPMIIVELPREVVERKKLGGEKR
jgi:hypothetical protein